jgi:hypothetical protein
MKTIVALFVTLLPLGFANAQQQGTDEQAAPEEPKSYTVEIIIFTYSESVGVGTEQFPPDMPEPAPMPGDETDETAGEEPDAGAVADTGTAETPESGSEPATFEFHVLTSAEYTLQDTLDRLKRLDVYRPVMHFGWTQAVYPRDETPPIELRTFGEPPPGLDGQFTLYLSRFLHLVVDLSLEAESPDAGRPVASFRDDRDGFGAGEPELPVHYRIEENRIFKSGDIRYFDHPKFGVLAKVTRVDDTAEDTPHDSGPQALAGVVRQ